MCVFQSVSKDVFVFLFVFLFASLCCYHFCAFAGSASALCCFLGEVSLCVVFVELLF